MKAPKYAADSMQAMINAGLNAFAAQLLAESFADKPETFGDDNLMLLAHAHNGQEVWILLSKARPKVEDFTE